MACCVAIGCCNRATNKTLSFYRFPANSERRNSWINALKRENWRPSGHSRICSQHFVSGKKSDDPLSPDYIPSIFQFTSAPQKEAMKKKVTSFERRNDTKKRKFEQANKSAAASALLDLFSSQEPLTQQHEQGVDENENPNTNSNEIDTQTELTMDDIDEMDQTNFELQCSKMKLEKQLGEEQMTMDSFKENDEKVKVYTGLSHFALLMQVLNLVLPNLEGRKSSLSPFHQLLLTLMRLRLSSTVTYLSYVFKVHHSTIVRTFNGVIHILNEKFVPLNVFWPERNEVRGTLPYCFAVTFPKCVSIIDCFEVFIEKSTNLDTKAGTFSNYKHHNTVKYLISITPQGMVNFVSKGWGGRASDKCVTENCGYLDKLIPGDIVLADRGFTVQDTVGIYGASLKIPAFTKGKSQLEAIEINDTRHLASVRIHVERVIGNVRKKYSILDSTIPIPLLIKDETTKLTPLDKIVRVACGLSNICGSIIPFD